MIRSIYVAAIAAAFAFTAGPVSADSFVIDLTHPIPTYKPMEGDATKPDMSQPWLDSVPHPTFEHQAVLSIGVWPTNTGYFDSGKLLVDEHHGTHLDSLAHFLNNDETMEEGGIPSADRATMAQITPGELIGPIVLIDIEDRVRRELDKNGGQPSPDTSVTDFSSDSGNVVTADDVAAVADQLEDGVWLVLNLGWARFYFDATAAWVDPGWDQSVYLNGFNHPGMNREAVDKLAEIIIAKGIRLAGVAADNLAIDDGEGNIGVGPNMDTDVWYSHTRLFQRGALLLENVANISELAAAMNGGATCNLVVGAPKHVRGTGGPSRVFAFCES